MPAYRDDDPARLRLDLAMVPRGTAVSEVVGQLVALLTTGELAPGSRLPPERTLAESLGVGRSAVREALAALEILGIVHVRAGAGTYLRDSTSDLLPATLSWGLMLTASHSSELAEVRGGLEIEAARLAATRASDDDVATLRRFVADLRASLADPDRFLEADACFHLQLALCAGNVVLRDLLQSIRSLLRIRAERELRAEGRAAEVLREHEAVLAAVERRDPDAAGAAMTVHLTAVPEAPASAR